MPFTAFTSGTRSATGCFACKTKHKKCDEKKPQCLRCQKSGIECPGYMYVKNPKKPNRRPRTLPGPRTRVGQSQATAQQGAALRNTEDTSLKKQGQLVSVACEASSSTVAAVIEEAGGPSEDLDIPQQQSPPPSSNTAFQRPSIDVSRSRRETLDTTGPILILPSPSRGIAKPLTAGQASLLEALFSLSQPPDEYPPPQNPQPPICLFNPISPVISNQLHPETTQNDVTLYEDEDPEGLGVSVICRQPVLDRTLESNAMPFVLQSYTSWISRIAFDPSKLTGITRDFVSSYFEHGNQSRWIIGLLANIGSRIGSSEMVGGRSHPMVSALQTAVQRRLGAIKSRHNARRSELVHVLASVVETMIIHICVSPFSEVMALRQEAASIFRQLCPHSTNVTIDLLSLLQSPIVCLRNYASIDIIVCATLDLPSLFRYEVRILSSNPSDSYQSLPGSQGRDVLQCLHGLPNQLMLLFAKMQSMRQDGLTPDQEEMASLEQYIHDFQPFDESSADRFMAVIRFVVQECWRQASYVYLYMAVCGDPAGTSRVEKAFQRFIKLLSGTSPGRLPDEFLIGTFLVMSPAAQRQCDRKAIRERALGLHRRGHTFRINLNIISVIEDYWSRADAEGRQVKWSDVAVSWRRVSGS